MIKAEDHVKFAKKIVDVFGVERARWANLLAKGDKSRQLTDFGWLLFLALEAEDIRGRLDRQIQRSVRARWICWAACNHLYWNFCHLDALVKRGQDLDVLGWGSAAQARIAAWARENPPRTDGGLETLVFEIFCVAEGITGYENFPPASVESLAKVIRTLPDELITSFSNQASVATVQALGTMWSLPEAVNSTKSVELWYGKHWTALLREMGLREVAGAYALSPNLQLPNLDEQRADEYREILLKMRGGSHA